MIFPIDQLFDQPTNGYL